jgi:Tfp pilus assembly protein PilF
MMNIKWLIVLVIIAQSIGSVNVCAQGSISDASKTYALVVGISGYQNPAIPRLTYADKDATLFADWLHSKAGGSIPKNQVKLFTNEAATISGIYAALDWLKTQARKNDIVYIYFSGHGDIESRDTISQGYLLAWNSPATNYRNNAISVTDINECANNLTTRKEAKVIIISDACHSGKMAGDFYKGRQFTAANLQLVLNNQVRLASCEAHQQAAEGPAWGGGRGVFSWYLLKGLQGLAPANKQGIISLKGLQSFLDSSFKNDRGLAAENHQQNPVIDGSPLFPMARVDSQTLQAITAPAVLNNKELATPAAGALQSLKTLGQQPIDYFFSLAKTSELDSTLPFEKYVSVAVSDLPFTIVAGYISYLQSLQNQYDSLDFEYNRLNATRDSIYQHTDRKNKAKWQQVMPMADSLYNLMNEKSTLKYAVIAKKENKDRSILGTLQKQLQNNKYLVSRFNEKLVQLIHDKSQQMINAYLNGDLAELERRQYYYAGSRNYRSFLPVLDVAINLAPETNYLNSILKINRSYIAGLVDRLEMVTSPKRNSLLQSAFAHQRQALNQEPFAAYIQNELGNLFLQQKSYDSARYYFNYALMLSPTWAVPWSNKIRLNLAMNNVEEAKQAISTADSLQPNLAYVNVNAGLVMEKDSNWLAAEAYYLNAIAQNNIHYLPFERLGFLYIHTGRYALADSFFMEAQNRKDAFAINENAFDFGIELGGLIIEDVENYTKECNASLENVVAWKPLINLVKSITNLNSPERQEEDSEKKLKNAVAAMPALPLVHHYLGKKYYSDSNWVLAKQYLTEAICRYLPTEQLNSFFRSQLKELLTNKPQEAFLFNEDSSCLLASLMNFQYEKLDDYYMLGKVFENLGEWDEAIKQYQKTAVIENQMQAEQARFTGYKKVAIRDEESSFMVRKQVRQFEMPIRMGGTLKAAGLLESLGRYKEAEEVLLQQVQLNRKAGYARQAEMNKGNFGPNNNGPFNYYWLNVNFDLEAETHNFYKRIVALLPRDAYWYQQAGMFLYDRLQLTYSQIPIQEQKMFYEYSKRYAYPFKGGVEGLMSTVEEDGNYYNEENKFTLPVTGEEIDIELGDYDPLQTSKSYLELAAKYSGETQVEPLLAEAVVNLDQWMGNADAAISGYTLLLSLQPDTNRLRFAYSELLEYYNRLPAAAIQLDSLYKRGTLNQEQKLKLAYYKVLNKQAKEGKALLDGMTALNPKEKNLQTEIYMQYLMQDGQLKKALDLYLDSFQNTVPAEEDPEPGSAFKKLFFDNPYYTAARLYAMQKQDARAFEMVSSMLDSGFNYLHVLKNDPALFQLRKTNKWKKMWQRFAFKGNDDSIHQPRENILYHPVLYRIPGSNPGL